MAPELGSERDNLLDLLSDALDEFEPGGSDLAGLVLDVDSVIEELTPLADPTSVANLRNQWSVLAQVLLIGEGSDQLHGAVRGLRFLIGAWPNA